MYNNMSLTQHAFQRAKNRRWPQSIRNWILCNYITHTCLFVLQVAWFSSVVSILNVSTINSITTQRCRCLPVRHGKVQQSRPTEKWLPEADTASSILKVFLKQSKDKSVLIHGRADHRRFQWGRRHDLNDNRIPNLCISRISWGLGWPAKT